MAGRDFKTHDRMRAGGGADPLSPSAEAKRNETRALDELSPNSTRSPLTDTFPTLVKLRSALGRIPAPAAGITFDAGRHAVFPLFKKQVAAIGDDDLLMVAVHGVLGSTGNTDSQQTGSPWGSANGLEAGVIVAHSIPGLKPATGLASSWCSILTPMPYVDVAIQSAVMEDQGTIFSTPFPPGNLATSPSMRDPAEDFPPHVIRLRKSRTIEAAVVITRARAVAAQSSGVAFRCVIDFNVRLGNTFTVQGLGQG